MTNKSEKGYHEKLLGIDLLIEQLNTHTKEAVIILRDLNSRGERYKG